MVATGRRLTAENLFVRLTLKGNAHGYGEMAPFPEVGGEDRASAQEQAVRLASAALGQSALQSRRLARQWRELAPGQPAARCGMETALLDALCRHLGVPLWGLWGGADVREHDTDITIPITTVEQTVARGRAWYRQGFRLFKIKVGTDVDEDSRRLEALQQALPDTAFIVDANQGFSQREALAFLKEARRCGATVVLLEQPVPGEDLDSLAAVRREGGVPVAADEAVRTVADARAVVRRQAADVINIKIMKSGLFEAMEIAAVARAAGLRLMIGGMVETRVAMGCSFALVLGAGGFDFLDLDTPLLLAEDPVKGGYRYAGPRLQPWWGAGLDLELTEAAAVTIE